MRCAEKQGVTVTDEEDHQFTQTPRDPSVSPADPVPLLEDLVRGRVPEDSGLPDPPEGFAALLDGSVDLRVVDLGALPAVLGSWLGPRVCADLCVILDPPAVRDAVLRLPAVPLGLPRVLHALAAPVHADAALDARVYARLESMLASFASRPSGVLLRDLGLPRSLGAILDGQVRAVEEGGPLPSTASAVTPLLVSLERLGVRRVWDLLPGSRGGMVRRAGDLPVDVLAASVESLHLLGANATALRVLVLVLLLSDRVETVQRRLLTRLLLSPGAGVPPEKVVEVWSLANR